MSSIAIDFGRLRLRITPMHWAVMGLVAFGWGGRTLPGKLVALLVIVLSILLHELAHALTALSLGAQSADIELNGFGGLTHPHADPPLGVWKDCAVSASGPLSGLALVFLAMVATWSGISRHLSASVQEVLFRTIQLNVGWSLFNLIPIEPMDGGSLLRRVLGHFFGLRGLKTASVITILLAVLIGSMALLVHQTYIAMLVGICGVAAYHQLKRWGKRTASDDDPALQAELHKAQQEINEQRLADATTRLIALRKQTAKGVIYTAATELLARVFTIQKQYGAAYPLLSSVESDIGYESLTLLQQLACNAGDCEKALSLGARLFPERQEAYVAYVNSAACAHLGRTEKALDWMRTALRLGLADPVKAFADEEFDSLRTLEAFKDALSEHAAAGGEKAK